MDMFSTLPVISKHRCFLEYFFRVRDDNTAISVTTEVFRGIKTEGRYIAEGSDFFPFVKCAVRLTRVFHYLNAMFFADIQYFLEFARVSIEMYGDTELNTFFLF